MKTKDYIWDAVCIGVAVAALYVALTMLAGDADAGECQPFFQHHSYVAPVVNHHQAYQHNVAAIVTPIYHAIGYPLQAEAQKTYTKRTDTDWQEFLEYKAFKAGQDSQRLSGAQKEPKQTNSVLAAKCASCHGKVLAAPKGGVYYDAEMSLSAESKIEALRRISLADDDPLRMPPPSTPALSAEEKGAAMQELLNAKEN